MKVEFKFYDKFDDYEKLSVRKKVCIQTYSLSLLDLMHYSWVVGLSYDKTPIFPSELKRWKQSFIEAFVDDSGKKLKFKNLDIIETTEKGSVAYFLGMIFTYAFMCKEFKVKHLFHLSNREIMVGNVDDMQPDLWGYVDHNESYLVEAKGSLYNAERFETLEDLRKANSQLRSVFGVKYTYTDRNKKGKIVTKKRSYTLKKLKKIIIGTHPSKDFNIRQEIIDPTEGTNLNIEIDGDKSIYHYYFNIMRLLVSNKNLAKEETIHEENFIVLNSEEFFYKIGLLKVIYDVLENYHTTDKEPDNFVDLFKEIDMGLEQFNTNLFDDNNTSIGLDGIIVMKK